MGERVEGEDQVDAELYCCCCCWDSFNLLSQKLCCVMFVGTHEDASIIFIHNPIFFLRVWLISILGY